MKIHTQVTERKLSADFQKRELNGNWRGGRSLKDGYVILRMPEHPNAFPNGYFPEHRLVMEKKLGRYLEQAEVVHHINGNKQDNRIENLVVTTHHLHGKEHWKDPMKREERSEFMKKKRAERFWSTRKKT